MRGRQASARRLERPVRLLRGVLRHLVLLPRGVHLRAPLVVLALRYDFLIEQRLDAVELRLRQVERRLCVHHLGNVHGVERLPGREPETCFDLRRVCFGFRELRRRLFARNPREHRALRHVHAALDGSRHDAARAFRHHHPEWRLDVERLLPRSDLAHA